MLFMSMGCDYVSELRHPTVHPSDICVRSPGGMMLSVTLSTTNPTWRELGPPD
jgi:hypothetical protein